MRHLGAATPGELRRHDALHRALGRVWRLFTVMLLLAGHLARAGDLATTGTATVAPPVARITHAEFGPSRDGPWQAIPLPDAWRDRGLDRPGTGWYRLRLPLAATDLIDRPPTMWALYTRRMGTRHRVWLNGVLLDDGSTQRDNGLPRLLPWLLPVPSSLLHTGNNLLELEIHAGLRAGQADMLFGSLAELDELALAHKRQDVDLPVRINLLAAGACLVAMLLWLRRRSEVAMGWFGVLGLLISLRNQAYFDVGPSLPPQLSNLSFFLAQVLSGWLLGRFAVSITQYPLPSRYPRLLDRVCLLLALAGVGASLLGDAVTMDRARLLAYPVLVGCAILPALWLLARHGLAQRGARLGLLLAMLAVVAGAAGHDYLFQQGLTPLQHERWLPYATPLLVLAYATVMVRRLVTQLDQVEVLNRTLELRVLERTQALAEANDAKSRFVAAASHDLRQPVAAIGLMVSLLQDQLIDPAQRAMANKVDEAVAALEALLAGLTDLSRLESGALQARPQPVVLQALFDAVRVHLVEATGRKGLALRIDATPCVVQSDPLLLEQIVRNLVDNAVHYTERGGVRLRARVLAGQRVRVQVWDSGCGIAARDRQRAFLPFVRLREHEGSGQGLGLAIVQRSAALIGAPLQLRSRLGRGSCFSITLPLLAAPNRAPSAAALPERWLAGRHLLLVEDDATVRMAVRTRLQAWGAEVSACDALPAVQALLASVPTPAPDLLVTDLRLPGANGFVVVKEVRQACGAELPVLVITGNTAPDDLKALTASGLAVLHKPFRAEQLQLALQRLLDGLHPATPH